MQNTHNSTTQSVGETIHAWNKLHTHKGGKVASYKGSGGRQEEGSGD